MKNTKKLLQCKRVCPVVLDLRKELEDTKAKLALVSTISRSLEIELRLAKSIGAESRTQNEDSLVLISKLQNLLTVFQASRLSKSGPKITGGP